VDYCFIFQETELEEKPGNLRESREVRRHQQRMNVPTNLIKGDVQRLDFEIFNPQLLTIYKACYIRSSLVMLCLVRSFLNASIRVIFV